MAEMKDLREALYQAGVRQLQVEQLTQSVMAEIPPGVGYFRQVETFSNGVGYERRSRDADGNLVITRRRYRDAEPK